MLILILLGSLNIEEGHVIKLGQPMDIWGFFVVHISICVIMNIHLTFGEFLH